MDIIAANHLVIREHHTSEAIRTLYTSLPFIGKEIRAIGLTNSRPEDDRTAISFQLAASIAHAGKRVLLLDADLRKSVLPAYLQITDSPAGLSHYLSGQASAEEVLRKTDIPGMSILFSGAPVPNAQELLSRDCFQALIRDMKERFDYVIVDTTPLGQIPDCAVIAPSLDGTVIVVDAARNSSRQVRRIRDLLEKSGGRILGVALNRVKHKACIGPHGNPPRE